jgi:hypothetical protein
VSVPLFSNQTDFTGLVAKAVPGLGDIAFLVGFLLAAAVYAVLRPWAARNSGAAPTDA